MRHIFEWLSRQAMMADVTGERDSDRDSLTDWMLVDNEDTIESNDNEEHVDDEVEINPDERTDDQENDEEEDEEQDLISLRQKVEEVKEGSSGHESSDIETLEPSAIEEVDNQYIHNYDSMRSSFVSRGNPTCGGIRGCCGGEADTESLSSENSYLDYEEKIRRRRNEKSEATQDEETDLSLASCPSLPDNLPAIKPEAQYVHTPDKEFNHRLNLIVALTLACVLGLGVGHFLGIIDITEQDESGWSSRTLWEVNLNAAQIVASYENENENLNKEIKRVQSVGVKTFKISGKDGRECRQLREEISVLINEIEEMRLTNAKAQFSKMPDADKELKDNFGTISRKNFDLRVILAKLKHMDPEIENLKKSLKTLKAEKEELASDYASLKFQQAVPQELGGIMREVEGLKQLVSESSKKENPPPTIPFAKSYIAFMSQVFSSFSPFPDKNKADIFTQLVSKSSKLSTVVEGKVRIGKAKFHEIRQSLATKWDQLRSLSHPENIAAAGISTLNKMNRVIVNVVSKLREIGHSTLIKRRGVPLDKTVSTLSDKLKALSDQFDATWNTLEGEVKLTKIERERIFGEFLAEDIEETVDFDGEVDEEEEEDETIQDETNKEDKKEEIKKDIDSLNKEEKVEILDTKIEEMKKIPVDTSTVRQTENLIKKAPDNHQRVSGINKKTVDMIQDKETLKTIEKKEKIEMPRTNKRELHSSELRSQSTKNKRIKEAPVEKEATLPTEQKELDTHILNEIIKEEMKDRLHELKEAQRQRHKQEEKAKENVEIKKDLEERKRAKEPQRRKSHLQDDSRFYKGQYNKYKNIEFDEEEEENLDSMEDRLNRLRTKLQERHQYNDENDDDDEDEDDDDYEDQISHQNSYKGLKKHWEKPQKKKSFFREHSGPNKQFIRRKAGR